MFQHNFLNLELMEIHSHLKMAYGFHNIMTVLHISTFQMYLVSLQGQKKTFISPRREELFNFTFSCFEMYPRVPLLCHCRCRWTGD